MANRGTKASPRSKDRENWTGKDFRKFLDGKLKELNDEDTISVGRGTGKAKVKDIKKKKGYDRKKASKGRYVSTGRGTGRRKL